MNKKLTVTLVSLMMCLAGYAVAAPVRVLILSGQNNHDWKKTTPVLQKILTDGGRFTVDMTEHPEQCDSAMFAKYDVILSNWNTFGKPAVTNWPAGTRAALLDFVRSGKGFVVVHAGSSSFYDWPEYQQLAGVSWKRGQTSHGKPHEFTVMPVAEHPITHGLDPFTTTDELWVKSGVETNAVVLATGDDQPVALVTWPGQGRGFTLLLGHSDTFMANSGFQTLLRRGVEWASTGKVSAPTGKSEFTWQQTNGSLALLNHGETVWKLNFAEPDGKPFFHPLRLLDGTELTRLRPKDHPWHLGLWWSWKFINGVNYWELDRKTGRYEGATEIVRVRAMPNPDHSARVEMELSYHLPQQAPVLTEKRLLVVSAPDEQGNYAIDWDSTFVVGAQDVKLDRTPILGQPGGQSWGGYAGLSVRLPEAAKKWTFTGAANGQHGDWVDFSRPTGGGVAIVDSPKNPRHPSLWYLIQNMPFFTPAFLYKEPYALPSGKSLTLCYRVVIHTSQTWSH